MITLRKSKISENGVIVSGKSVAKLRENEITGCKNGVQITGKGTKADAADDLRALDIREKSEKKFD